MEEYRERKQNGGCRKRGFTEGWVEFMEKKIAKKFVRRYNGQPIGGKKRNPFFEELWCVKYLSKFKWDHLLEGIRKSQRKIRVAEIRSGYRKMMHRQEIQQELAEAKKQQEVYLNRVQTAKRLTRVSDLPCRRVFIGFPKSERNVQMETDHGNEQVEPLPDPVDKDSSELISDDLLALFGGRS